MLKRNFFRLVCMAAVVMGLLFVPATPRQATNVAAGQMALALQAPPFVNVARASEASQTTFDLAAYLDQEVGISAYYKSPDAITLSQAKTACRSGTVPEIETPDYFICSVAVPNYPENFEAHVYVHRTGWILAYYLRPDPVSKIVDVYNKTISTTKLKTVVSIVAGIAGAPFSDVTYYDFRYPNATNMLLVAEDDDNGPTFTITLPSYGYLDRGWGAYDTSDEVDFYVDGTNLWSSATWTSDTMAYGSITAEQLLPGIEHTFTVENNGDDVYAVLIIVYRVSSS